MSHMNVPAHERVDSPEQVRINGVNYRIKGGVQRFLASTFPQKIVTGDYEEESHPFISTVTWNDLRGGMLKEFGDFPGDENRVFYTNLNSRHAGHLSMNPLAESFGLADTGAVIERLALYQRTLYSVSESGLVQRHFDVLSDTKVTLTSSATSFWGGNVDGLKVLAAPQGERIQWTHSGIDDSTWYTDSSEKITHVESWRNLLWGINDSAELFFAENLDNSSTFTWTNTARADLNDTGLQQGLVVGPDRRLYLVSKQGLHIYDRETETFDHVMQLPEHRDGGNAFTVHQGSIFYSQGLSIWKFTPTGTANVVDRVGLDLDAGLPSRNVGTIVAMNHGIRELYVAVDRSSSEGVHGIYSLDDQGWNALTTQSDTNMTTIGKTVFVGDHNSSQDRHQYVLAFPQNRETVKLLHRIPLAPLTNPSLSDSLFWNYNVGSSVGSDSQQLVVYPWVTVKNEQAWLATSLRAVHSWVGSAAGALVDSEDYIELRYETETTSSPVLIGRVRGETDSFGESVFSAALKRFGQRRSVQAVPRYRPLSQRNREQEP